MSKIIDGGKYKKYKLDLNMERSDFSFYNFVIVDDKSVQFVKFAEFCKRKGQFGQMVECSFTN